MGTMQSALYENTTLRPLSSTFLFTSSSGRLEGKEKAVGEGRKLAKKAKEGVRSMSGFTVSSRAMACRETGLCQYGWLKAVLLLWQGMGDGSIEVQRERKEVRGSWGTGNNEEESLIHFLGLAFGL